MRLEIRRWHFDGLTRRHELAGQELPAFCATRLVLVRKWSQKSFVAMLLATGSSAASRLVGQPTHTVVCPKCSCHGANWRHYWRCWLNMEPPEDVSFGLDIRWISLCVIPFVNGQLSSLIAMGTRF